MRWQGGEQSGNVEDRRGMGGPIAVGGGIIGVLVLLFNLFTGGSVDPSQLPTGGQTTTQSPQEKAVEDKQAELSSVVLRSTEKVWQQVLPQQANINYSNPTMVLFSNATQSGCGSASSATGPFYCPADGKLYLDLSFFQELSNRFQATGDFAKAYVIAHEVGHHIQNLLGLTDKMQRLRQRVSREEYNKNSVKLELQADFLAGVWAHYAKGQGLLEAGDMDSALRAANAIGDDNLQKQAQGYAVPESFTHGSSEQRMYWLKKGYETGDLRQGDTFSDPSLN
jgi:uncharacterized protein